MNHLFVALASLLLHISAPSKHSALFTDRDIERSTPSVDSLQLAANIQTAYLADALRLRYAQTQRLNRCLVAQLQALDSLHYASAQLTAAERSVATDAVTAAYYRAVAHTLSAR